MTPRQIVRTLLGKGWLWTVIGPSGHVPWYFGYVRRIHLCGPGGFILHQYLVAIVPLNLAADLLLRLLDWLRFLPLRLESDRKDNPRPRPQTDADPNRTVRAQFPSRMPAKRARIAQVTRSPLPDTPPASPK